MIRQNIVWKHWVQSQLIYQVKNSKRRHDCTFAILFKCIYTESSVKGEIVRLNLIKIKYFCSSQDH